MTATTDGEKIVALEVKIEAVHQDIHMLSEQIATVNRAVDSLRNELHGRPSWGVVFALTVMSGLVVALASALAAVAVT